jgi:hypothetical protein
MKPYALALVLLVAQPVLAQLPARDLSVELRQIEEGSTGGYTVGTRPQTALLAPQQVLVRNGSKASFSLGQSIPLQWVQSVSSTTSTLTVPGADASSRGGSVSQALIWMDAGQSLAVKPRWAGGKQPVTVEVEMQSANLEPRPAAELPTQARSQLVTTVGAPLGQWVTIATTGNSQPKGVFSSDRAGESRRLLQLRVSLP